MRILPALAAVSLAANAIQPVHAQVDRSGTMAGRSTVYAPNGVVASSQPLATGAGLAALQGGGNTIDAAVTTAAMLNVVEPMMTGVGGDMFAIVWLADEQRMVGLNASGRAGALMTREALVGRGHESMPRSGAETITVPGALAGWQMLLDTYGTISLADALEPAIRMAEHGFPASPVIVDFWLGAQEMLGRDEGARATFLIDGERAPRTGEWFSNPDFARTLRLIAERGSDVLYRGELGEAIVQRVSELGGFLTMDDLRSHSVDWVEPISVPYRGYRLHGARRRTSPSPTATATWCRSSTASPARSGRAWWCLAPDLPYRIGAWGFLSMLGARTRWRRGGGRSTRSSPLLSRRRRLTAGRNRG